MVQVKEVMTDEAIKYCNPETKIHEAVKLMKQANCGALPVLDKNNHVVGLVTDRDIALSISEKEKDLSKKKIGEIMTENPVSVKTDDDIWVALKEMRTNKIGRLPVTDSKGKLQGVLSMNNLLQHYLKGDMDLGDVNDKGENLIKTAKAIEERNKKKKPEMI